MTVPWKTRRAHSKRHASTEQIEKQIAHGIGKGRLQDAGGVGYKKIQNELVHFPQDAHENSKAHNDNGLACGMRGVGAAPNEKEIGAKCRGPRAARAMHEPIKRTPRDIPIHNGKGVMERHDGAQRKSKPNGLPFGLLP